jgi:hypothetical protein
MKIIKKYTAIKVGTETVGDELNVKLSYGKITGPYYSKYYPTEEFDTEDEAIKYACNTDKWCSWLIVPIIRFDNFE